MLPCQPVPVPVASIVLLKAPEKRAATVCVVVDVAKLENCIEDVAVPDPVYVTPLSAYVPVAVPLLVNVVPAVSARVRVAVQI
jgi:hypothetical protein